eukprot:g14700.t1 g14700   contig90:207447-209825(-)
MAIIHPIRLFSISLLAILPRACTSLTATSSIISTISSSTSSFDRRSITHINNSIQYTNHNIRRSHFHSSTALTMTTSSQTQLNILLFRQTDLRLHDNPALCRTVDLSLGTSSTPQTKKVVGAAPPPNSATTAPTGILPVFIFDTTRLYGSDIKLPLGNSLKCGPRRVQFALEAVADLRSNLEKRGSGLVVAVGNPEEILATIATSAVESSGDNGALINVVCQEEVCSEELTVDKAIRSSLAKAMKTKSKFNFETVWGSTMYDPETLPFDGGVFGIPDTFTPFRNKVEKICEIGAPLDCPKDEYLSLPKNVMSTGSALGSLLSGVNDANNKCSLKYMPTLFDLGYNAEDIESVSSVDSRTALPVNYRGGETFALQRVKDYIWDKNLLKVYFDTRNGMIGSDYSTKFAPWLALGNVSPRYIARECSRYEEQRVQNKSTYWVVLELLIRDHFKFFAKKHGDKVFYLTGTIGKQRGSERKWGMDRKKIQAWQDGMTGFPLVDANMRELAATGFMSNRGRQNVASFLTISTYWVVFELLWRDYFKFFAKKHGDKMFYLTGTIGKQRASGRKWGMDRKKIQAWQDGMTGFPLVDANMRELAATGFMSNRGRQNVASFLTIDMNMDWRYGGEYFEETLLDYDVHSNWGNWCSAAGMTGGRLNRFNIVKQSKDYDFGGEYVRLWCPELKNVPDKYVHSPWEMSDEMMEECGVKIGHGRDYPSPIVDPRATPKAVANDNSRGGGRGGGRGEQGRGRGGKSGGGRGSRGRDNPNPNRGRGQRQDMKSLKTGSYRFDNDSKYV